MSRARLPNCRPQVSFVLQRGEGKHGRFTVSAGGDGISHRIREVFVSGSPSDVMDVVRDGAILVSLALQHGCPLETISKALTRDDADLPATVIGAVVEQLIVLEGPA